MSDALKDRLVSDWMEALKDYSLEEIQTAIKQIQADKPKDATNEEVVAKRIVANRGRKLRMLPKATQPAPEPETVTPEQKAKTEEILNSFLKRAPRNHAESVKQAGGEQ
ncbi:hypothetical protein OU789_10910 [Halocynthiibacter sp. C4]|uniref:hypothetical protein n=1 Tax=Halocynthiibacter sp. C4 TaxID=2992758 RepID=UPI00237BA1D4|nr:hypothetical protein [Halocynthiibacter sp. C4]MDE0590437.1 hypothetical protein [Halocynthiibacter sp. C4]